jgi:hypothetical protein
VKEGGEEKIIFSKSVLPSTFSGLEDNFLYGNDPQIIACIVLMVLGFFTVFGAELLSKKLQAK